MKKMHANLIVIILGASTVAASANVMAAPDITVFENATLIDGTGAPSANNKTVVIDGNRIVRIVDDADQLTFPVDARRIDLNGAFLLPGLWNNHVHPSDILPDPKKILGDEPLLAATIRAGRNLTDALRRGFTTVRSAGERDFIDVAWRDAFDNGVFVGPRVLASGPRLASPGGWSRERPLALEFEGPKAAKTATLSLIDKGVDVIKLMLNGLSEAEMKAVIDTAHEHGKKVAGDASEPYAGIAVNLGIDSIEHGDELTDETIRLMVANEVAYDPTVVCNLSAMWIEERETFIASAIKEQASDVVAGRVVVPMVMSAGRHGLQHNVTCCFELTRQASVLPLAAIQIPRAKLVCSRSRCWCSGD
jgi:imidazolonepropionase-like amidohydrolase